jgi:hypothetical protein
VGLGRLEKAQLSWAQGLLGYPRSVKALSERVRRSELSYSEPLAQRFDWSHNGPRGRQGMNFP